MEITVIIPTSPIPSCPDTTIIDKTIASVKSHLPDAPIIITCDGATTIDYRYQAYCSRLRRYKSDSLTVLEFQEHVHQSGMLPVALKQVKTPLVLYLEHDWEIGIPVEWDAISRVILSGAANYVKFHAGNRIHPLHEHMMAGHVKLFDAPFIKTVQYSANPHVARRGWYESLGPFFQNQVDFIENLLHGPIANAPWDWYKLMIYNPIQGDMKRAMHLDGKHSK